MKRILERLKRIFFAEKSYSSRDFLYRKAVNFSLIAPQSEHLSGASPSSVYPQTSRT
jgi:hypothetical protein